MNLLEKFLPVTVDAKSKSRMVTYSKDLSWTGIKNVSKYFNEREIDGLDLKLVAMLDQARESTGIPFIITSGFRDSADNATAGGVEDSPHTKGLAVDLRVSNSNYRFKMLRALFSVGFNRIGIYDRHIHVDIDLDKPQNVIWTGESH